MLSLLRDMYDSQIMKAFYQAENHVASRFEHYQVELKEALFQQGSTIENYIPTRDELEVIYNTLNDNFYQHFAMLFDSEGQTGPARPYIPLSYTVNRYFESLSDRYYADSNFSQQNGFSFKFRYSNPASENPNYNVVTPYLAFIVQEHLTRTLTSVLKWHQLKVHALSAYSHYQNNPSTDDAAEISRKLMSLIALQDGLNESECVTNIDTCIEQLNENMDQSVQILKDSYLKYAGLVEMNVIRNVSSGRVVQIVSGLASTPVTLGQSDRYTRPVASFSNMFPTADTLLSSYPEKTQQQVDRLLELKLDMFDQINELTGMYPVLSDPTRNSDISFLSHAFESPQNVTLEDAMRMTGSYIYQDLLDSNDVHSKPTLIHYNHMSKEPEIFPSIALNQALPENKRWSWDMSISPWIIPRDHVGMVGVSLSLPDSIQGRTHYVINRSSAHANNTSFYLDVEDSYNENDNKLDLIFKRPTYVYVRGQHKPEVTGDGVLKLFITEDPKYGGALPPSYIYEEIPINATFFNSPTFLGSFGCTNLVSNDVLEVFLPPNRTIADLNVNVSGEATKYVTFDKAQRGDRTYIRSRCLRDTIWGGPDPNISGKVNVSIAGEPQLNRVFDYKILML